MTPRNAIVMLALGALCLLAYLMLGGDEAATQKVRPFADFDKSDVTEVSASSQGEEFTLRRRSDASDRWELSVAGYWVRANAVALDEMLGALIRGEVRKHYASDVVTPNDIAAWGLDEPRVVLDLQLGSVARTYRFGGAVRDRTALYVDNGPGTAVWVVATDAHAELVNMFTNGVREFRISDVATYDVKRMEILEGGTTKVAVELDLSQIWRVSHAYDDYAHPQEFESNTLSPLCTEKVSHWIADGETILATYGLDEPRAELRLTRKQGGEPFVLFVGKDAGEAPGGAYVLEKGTQSVGIAPERFVKALFRNPLEYRDRSFSRIGIEGVGLTVLLGEGDGQYRLQKEGTEWDLIKPVRDPADGKAVRRVLDEIRNWHVHEFLDDAKPEDKGIDGEHLVRIDRAGGEATTLLIGDPAEDGKSYFAQRKDDSGVVRVGDGPIRTLLEGVLQYKRRTVAEFHPEELTDIGRDSGRSEAGKEVQKLVFARDDGQSPWRDLRSGSTGTVDEVALASLVNATRTIVARKWVHVHHEDRVKYGIHPDQPATTRLHLTFHARSGLPDEELEPILIIGNPHEGGGYYAHLLKHRNSSWAFVLSDDVVEILTADIIKP